MSSHDTSGTGIPRSEIEWYVWGRTKKRWFGNLLFHVAASLTYLGVALFPLSRFILCDNFSMPRWPKEEPWLLVAWILFVSLSYPLWAWQETRAFERWCAEHAGVADEQRRQYALHSRLAENFWKAVWGIYSVAGVVGIALKP